MPSLLGKAIDKLPGPGKSSNKDSAQNSPLPSDSETGSSKSRSGSTPNGNGRVIPPEPIQQNTNGDAGHQENEPALAGHNLVRAGKLVPALSWDTRLAADAEEYAQVLADMDKLRYSDGEAYGENLYFSPEGKEMEDAVSKWMDGEKSYNGEQVGAPGNNEDWLQFSQCLWHNTRLVGMGKATGKNGSTYIVARYHPRGNVRGSRPFDEPRAGD